MSKSTNYQDINLKKLINSCNTITINHLLVQKNLYIKIYGPPKLEDYSDAISKLFYFFIRKSKCTDFSSIENSLIQKIVLICDMFNPTFQFCPKLLNDLFRLTHYRILVNFFVEYSQKLPITKEIANEFIKFNNLSILQYLCDKSDQFLIMLHKSGKVDINRIYIKSFDKPYNIISYALCYRVQNGINCRNLLNYFTSINHPLHIIVGTPPEGLLEISDILSYPIVKIINPVTSTRRITHVFGSNLPIWIKNEKWNIKSALSIIIEAIHTLKSQNTTRYTKIIDYLQQAKISYDTHNFDINSNIFIILASINVSENLSHALYFLVENCYDGTYLVTVCERGFYKIPHHKDSKMCHIPTYKFNINELLNLMKLCSKSNNDNFLAHKVFTEMSRTSKLQGKYPDHYKLKHPLKSFKEGTCTYSNAKTLILMILVIIEECFDIAYIEYLKLIYKIKELEASNIHYQLLEHYPGYNRLELDKAIKKSVAKSRQKYIDYLENCSPREVYRI